jgi:hypothetical protein
VFENRESTEDIMNKAKLYFDRALQAFVGGLYGEAPPVQSPRAAKILSGVRDILLSIIELVLTIAGVFTYALTTSGAFKTTLAIAIFISALRTYATFSRFWDGIFADDDIPPPGKN